MKLGGHTFLVFWKLLAAIGGTLVAVSRTANAKAGFVKHRKNKYKYVRYKNGRWYVNRAALFTVCQALPGFSLALATLAQGTGT